jgi:hypothetical protein
MPSQHQSQPSQPLPIKPPTCPACAKAMKLTSVTVDKSFLGLRHMLFICECGWTSDQLVADKE